MAEKLTLASMCAGGVQERIDRALAKISDNILDLNTDAKKKRVPYLRQMEAHGRMRRKPTSKRISKKNLQMYQTSL